MWLTNTNGYLCEMSNPIPKTSFEVKKQTHLKYSIEYHMLFNVRLKAQLGRDSGFPWGVINGDLLT